MIKEENIGESTRSKGAKLPSKLPKTSIVKDASPKKSSSKIGLSYSAFPERAGKSDWSGEGGQAGAYRAAAKAKPKGQAYQGASGTWYRDGVRIGKGPGPLRLKHPEAVQRAYNERVARDIESRKRQKPRLKYE